MSNEDLADKENAAGMAHVGAGRIAEAIPHFERASRALPDDELIRNNLGAALVECGRHAEALPLFDAILTRSPNNVEVHHNRAVALRALGQPEQSIEAAEAALRLRPNYADALVNLAMAQLNLGRLDEARIACRRALSLQPRSLQAIMLLGRIAARAGNFNRALELFQAAIALDPGLSDAYLRAGSVLVRLKRLDEAIASFERASALPGNQAKAFVRLGDTQTMKRRRSAAVESFERALELDPSLAFARVQRLHELSWQCRWADIAKEALLVPSLGIEGDPVSPFAMLALEDAPERHRIRSERFAALLFSSTTAATIPGPRPTEANSKIRLGYFSADFYEHATAYLTARLFELHDRSRFEVHAFSYGPTVRDPMSDRLKQSFDAFHDISATSDPESARLAREVGIDIAIDLKGYTENQRLGIFGHRAAPVQISFLGYPGTTGAPFIDYLVADPHVIPEAEREYYSESLIVMPHCYQPTDDQRKIGERPSRDQAGLPLSGFVFTSFNQSWKISAAEFDCWAGLLNSVDGSVLWLLASDADAERNLRREIGYRGTDPSRLVFAPFLPQEQHLARLALADLFLDTFHYGAHTTASDALCAGVPVVTCAGRGFATRVATSILHAVGLPEFATANRDDYAAAALELARNPDRMRQVRSALARYRKSKPLFNSEGFTRAFERGLEAAHGLALRGEAPADIRVGA